MKLSDWARQQGATYKTAWKCFKQGKLPAPAEQLPIGKAFQNFFRGGGRYPQFHKKGRDDSARLDNGPGTFQVQGKRIKLQVMDSLCGEIRRQLEYKRRLYGSHLVVVDRWYPSSNTCSACGTVNAELKLPDRVWVCSACGVVHDRDLNTRETCCVLA